MKPRHAVWYLGIAMWVAIPMGLRVLAWRAPAPQEIEPAMAQAGQKLFVHEFTPRDPICVYNGGDGLGPVFNAASCVACHQQGGVGGSGSLEHNVTVFTRAPKAGARATRGVIHQFA